MDALPRSGEPRVAATGAVRDASTGKGRVDLLFLGFPRALLLLAKHKEKGAVNYGDRNWEKGQPMAWHLDSGGRHVLKWAAGMTDEDHLLAAAWNLLAAIETRERVAEGILPADLALVAAMPLPPPPAIRADGAWGYLRTDSTTPLASDC